ncbi:MAG: hypothetical protein ACREHC_03990 [Candidatus Levyibacteriota bacterium]
MSKSARKKTAIVARKQALKENQPKKKRKIIDKKPHVEFIASVLTIPSLLLLIILNYNSLKNMNGAKPPPTPAPNATFGNGTSGRSGFFSSPIGTSGPQLTQDPLATSIPCDKSLGETSITSPDEGDKVSDNPVEVDISYDSSTHCGAVWSYRINGGDWSNYDDRSVALYNLPNGAIKFELRVKSIASSDTTSLTRNFIYNGQNTATTPTGASGSAH